LDIYVLSIFPDFIQEYTKIGIIRKAVEKGLIEITSINLRDFTEDKYRTTDDHPYGGGAGMIMKVAPVWNALKSIKKADVTILLTPQGNILTQKKLRSFSKLNKIVLIAGRYKGVDDRIRAIADEEISIGDYILSGGELPALILIEGIVRLIPEVVGNEESINTDSFETGLLSAPYYTRPAEFMGMKVPEVLLSGDHQKIKRWRRQSSLKRTLKRRPDLLKEAKLTSGDKKYLDEIEKGDRRWT